jgi:glycosyltransferase involved in cell wall biosynthesis
MAVTAAKVIAAALRHDAALYHFHDPELIPGALLMRLLGKRVIYDVHEDLPRDVLSKDWIPDGLQRAVSLTASGLEWIASRTFSATVAATPTIAARFPPARVTLVQNFVRDSEFSAEQGVPLEARRAVAYVGSVTPERCAFEVVEAIARVARPDIHLIIAGEMSPAWLEKALAASPGWSRVDYRGYLDRAGVRRALAEARVGLAIFHPYQSYMESQPAKLFEYMAAGLPVIAADFPRFRAIVEANGCGICVPSQDPAAVAAAIDRLIEDPAQASEMGRRGRELVERFYNWESESRSLLGLYERVLGSPGAANEDGAPTPADS